ncbi:hypothetical protein PR048_026896 [Dryococelus australis]|uniref:Uncharacterized protein n=1 Tax=Dryococelus australis TaxID=614101 RepID=A0ABQ9GMM6_9NEOP|nr:hypothetical protein PR048_026896 [Dryococelus australis]
MDFLRENITVEDCHGQRYDNASNMSGKYSGLQARIKELNEFARIHSMLCTFTKFDWEMLQEAVIFFDFVESQYTFFSAFSHHCSLLSSALSDGGAHFPTVKRLSDTRWSARADSFPVLKQVLDDISHNNDQKAECRQQAFGLLSTMMKLETGIMITLRDQILQHFQMTSASLKSSGQDLKTACALYESLQGYIQALRSTFIRH